MKNKHRRPTHDSCSTVQRAPHLRSLRSKLFDLAERQYSDLRLFIWELLGERRSETVGSLQSNTISHC